MLVKILHGGGLFGGNTNLHADKMKMEQCKIPGT